MKYDIAFYEVFTEEEELLRTYLPAGYRYFFTSKSIQDTDTDNLPAPVISTRTQSRIPLGWADQLSAIFTRSTGFDHLTAYFRKASHAVPAGYLPRYAARAVAEQAFLLMLMLLRKMDLQRQAIRRFSRDGLTGSELRGKTLSIIGVGNIGSEIARIGYGMEMSLLGVDLVEREEISESYDLQYVELAQAVARCRILVCALPLTDATDRMLNYQILSGAHPEAILINIARGEIAPPEDLLRLLKEDKLAGAGLDVYDQESVLGSYLRGELTPDNLSDQERRTLRANQKLLEHPKVIATPHNAFNTRESTDRKSQKTAQNIKAFLEQGAFLTPLPVSV